MAYETGTASGVNDLLDKLRLFALANGWTVDNYNTRSDGLGQALLMNKSGLFVAILSDTVSTGNSSSPPNFMQTYTYPGPYVGATPNIAQAGKTNTSTTDRLAGPFTAYHFVAGAAYLHAIVEVVPGRFAHFGVGALDKAGGGTPCAYSYGTNWNFDPLYTNSIVAGHAIPFESNNGSQPGGNVRADSDGITPRNFEIRNSGSTRAVGGFLYTNFGLAQHMMRVGPSALTGRATLAPAIIMIERTPGVFSFAGSVPDFRFVRIDNMAAGDVLTIGADQWKCFPIVRKNGPAGVENSGAYGYAYLIG